MEQECEGKRMMKPEALETDSEPALRLTGLLPGNCCFLSPAASGTLPLTSSLEKSDFIIKKKSQSLKTSILPSPDGLLPWCRNMSPRMNSTRPGAGVGVESGNERVFSEA